MVPGSMIAHASAEEAIAIARRTAHEEGWAWMEPVEAGLQPRVVFFGSLRWEVTSNASKRGMNVRVRIDPATGCVVAKHFLPR